MWTVRTVTSKITRPKTSSKATAYDIAPPNKEKSAYEMFADDKIARDEALYEYGNRFGVLQDELRDLVRMDVDLARELTEIAQQRVNIAERKLEIQKKMART